MAPSISNSTTRGATFLLVLATSLVLGACLIGAAPRMARAQQLSAGTLLRVRLLDTLSSADRARGRAIRALVVRPESTTAPSALLRGVMLLGTIEQSGRTNDAGSRYLVVVRFHDCVLPSGERATCQANVTEVDNARETVDGDGRILGLPSPHLFSWKTDWAYFVLGTIQPEAAAALFAAMKGEELEQHRSFAFLPGVDMTVRLTAGVDLPPRAPPAPLEQVAPPEQLDGLIQGLPPRAYALNNREPGDLVNVIVLGDKRSVHEAFKSAGWHEARDMTLHTGFRTFAAVAKAQGYDHQPVSTLLLDDKPPDLVFEKVTDTFAKRHHIRLWHICREFSGQEVWVATATHDVGIVFSKERHDFTHRVDPHIDLERDKVVADFLTSGAVIALSLAPRDTIPGVTVNDGLNPLATDWRVAILRVSVAP